MRVALLVLPCLWAWLGLVLPGATALAQPSVPTLLARVDFAGSPAAVALPAHAALQDAAGQGYLLVFAPESALAGSGHSWRVLEAAAGLPEEYLLVLPLRAGAREAVWARFQPLADDGRQLLVRARGHEAAELAEWGCALQRLEPKPLRWSPPGRPQPKDGEPWLPRFTSPPDDRIATALDQVSGTNLFWLMRRLTGEEPLLSRGEAQVIPTRNTGTIPLRRAVEFATNRFATLGLQTGLHRFTNYLTPDYNVIATQLGGARSNEFILITAHLDNLPLGLAPGADDNASGCAAVLTAAGLFRQFQFERSIRYVLFSGEEQGLIGSQAYAGTAAANGDHIVGVLNLDMIAWASLTPPRLNLYTRRSNHPGFTNDLAIAGLLTNCVTAYGLSGQLLSLVLATGMGYSDHAAFWNRGYPAICVIENYGGDFNPHYHTTNDSVAHLNWNYFLAATRASLATLAHMARVTGFTPGGVIEVADSDWRGPGRGTGAFAAQWGAAAESGLDPLDVPWDALPPTAHAVGLRAGSRLATNLLQTEARPDGHDVRFRIELTARTTNGVAFPSTNRLRLEPLTGLAPDRAYTLRVRLDPAFTGLEAVWETHADLRTALDGGGFVDLPPLTGLTNDAVYGVCDLAIRALATNRADIPLTPLAGAEGPELLTRAQVGSRIVDVIQTALTASASEWETVATFTNQVPPDAASFEEGWRELTYSLDLGGEPDGGQRYFRLRRAWHWP